MQQNFSSTKLPTAASTANAGKGGTPTTWANPSRITADDGSSATWGAFEAGQGATITGSSFGFQQLPDGAVVDGIQVYIDGSNFSSMGDVSLNIAGSVAKSAGAFPNSYGSSTDLWGKTVITPAEIASIAATVLQEDVSGGDASASIDYLSITVFWHIELASIPADVPTRVAYKVYSRDGNYLGELPNVTSKLAFPQDINSAGSSLVVTCGQFIKNEVTVEPLLTEAGDIITTENDLPILTTSTDLVVTTGNSPDEAIFKNSNRVKVWMYNQYYPNGKLMFSGQINRVDFKYGGGDAAVKVTIYSDGLDLNNFIARGYPFLYTDDVVQTTWNSSALLDFRGPGWNTYGQTFKTGASVTNIGAIVVALQGTADVTVSLYDAVNGNLLGSVTKAVSVGAMTAIQFEFASLIQVTSNREYFFAMWLNAGQTMNIAYNTPSVYVDGQIYQSSYSGGSGGGSFFPVGNDLYFATKSGVPTTTTTYSSDDPVTDMANGILLDYNARGGLITKRDFDATGLSLTYTFVMATVFDALKKIIELSPTGFYYYVDLGTAEIDIQQISATPDFTIVRGRHINELDIALSIEQVKNYLLFSGGETAGTNLYRDYHDSESSAFYGLRTVAKTDNRVTLTATADAIGDSFIEENSDEQQETTLAVLNSAMDISLLTPGKTIGFKNFGNFIDDMVVQIVRREPNFSDGIARLTLGRLPVRMNDEIQRIQRELLNEQTIKNPSSPS